MSHEVERTKKLFHHHFLGHFFGKIEKKMGQTKMESDIINFNCHTIFYQLLAAYYFYIYYFFFFLSFIICHVTNCIKDCGFLCDQNFLHN